MLTFQERIALITESVARIREACTRASAESVLEPLQLYEALGGRQVPSKLFYRVDILTNLASLVFTSAEDLLPGGHHSVHCQLSIRTDGTWPPPDPMHVLAGALGTPEGVAIARHGFERALDWVQDAIPDSGGTK